ncbi:MAG: radical SAM protein [Brevinematales bacterium]|nr:radical SAM protein [Brevinematales bacterium]
MYKTIYGPVPSRRLGISLGVDIVPHKICSFNCVYCECGKNTILTTERRDFVPIDFVISEIEDFLSKNPAPDYISISGSGEPTLHSELGTLISKIKKKFPDIKLALLTNSSLLNEKKVREEIYPVDLVLPSLDAATEKAFKKIDRPFNSIKLENIIKGIADLVSEMKNISTKKQIWLEIFIIEGINTDEENIYALKKAIEFIKPDKVQLNTLDRPGTEDWVKSTSIETLESIKEKLNLPNIEIISKFKHRDEIKHYRSDIEATILETIKRRPLRLEDISEILGLSKEEIRKYIDILMNENKIIQKTICSNGSYEVFYGPKR